VAALGADVVVTGSAIFDGRDARSNLAFMQASLGAATPT
jgi:hypothetical protein